ncbi:MAG: sugar transferase, partial [Acidimicrobiia bacterium]|nr:sugar transferase [Acidimicrobiia bacterium]
PLALLIAAGIRIDSPGPILFTHTRIGKGGRPFRLRKFRTMPTDSDPYQASPAGDRATHITRVGRVLRATGLDELPQLLNVLRGEMSLVGPRPEMPFIVEGYGPRERARLRVKPGITGLWQISPDRHAQIHENLEYDLYYIHYRSLLLDLVVLIETVFATIEISFKRLFPGGHEVDIGPSGLGPSTDENARRRYVLLAMDQRRTATIERTWQEGIDIAFREAARLPVRVTTTSANMDDLEELVRSSNSSRSLPTRVRFVEVSSPGEVRPMLSGASSVVTDLSPIAAWALEQGTPLVAIDSSG